METFQQSSAVLKRKYNCAVLFFSQSYCLFIYVSKIFSHRPPLYNLEFSDVLEKTEFTELPAGCNKNKSVFDLIKIRNNSPLQLYYLASCIFNSSIHKVAGLTAHGRCMALAGTIPENLLSCEWDQWPERSLKNVQNDGPWLCEYCCKCYFR